MRDYKDLAVFTILIIGAIVCAVIFSGCSRKTITVVERRDSIITQSRIDTVKLYHRDSVIMMQRGDTFFVEKWKIRERERVNIVRDTLTQRIKEPVTIEREKAVTPKWAWGLLLINIGFALLFVATIILKLKK